MTRRDEAVEYVAGEDVPATKLAYWSGHLSGVCGLDAATAAVEYVK